MRPVHAAAPATLLAPWLVAWEIWLAAPQVIAHRMTRLMWGGWPPTPADQREYLRMVQEKGEALMEAWVEVVSALPRGMAAVAGAGLRPVHRRVTANRRRLAAASIRSLMP